MGGPIGNVNAVRTGKRTQRHGIVLGALGKRHRSINGYLKQLRKALESQAEKAHGTLSLIVIAEINLVVRYEMTARVAQKIVADREDLPPSEIVNHLKTIAWATQQRNMAIGRLKLAGGADNAGPEDDSWAIFDATRQQQPSKAPDASSEPPPSGDSEDTPGTPDAPAAGTEPQAPEGEA